MLGCLERLGSSGHMGSLAASGLGRSREPRGCPASCPQWAPVASAAPGLGSEQAALEALWASEAASAAQASAALEALCLKGCLVCRLGCLLGCLEARCPVGIPCP